MEIDITTVIIFPGYSMEVGNGASGILILIVFSLFLFGVHWNDWSLDVTTNKEPWPFGDSSSYMQDSRLPFGHQIPPACQIQDKIMNSFSQRHIGHDTTYNSDIYNKCKLNTCIFQNKNKTIRILVCLSCNFLFAICTCRELNNIIELDIHIRIYFHIENWIKKMTDLIES